MAEIKYIAVIKVGNQPDGQAKRIKYEYVNNLKKLADYLDQHHSTWRFMNVFDREYNHLASFTKNHRPTFAKIPEGFSQVFEKRQFRGY